LIDRKRENAIFMLVLLVIIWGTTFAVTQGALGEISFHDLSFHFFSFSLLAALLVARFISFCIRRQQPNDRSDETY
jgi:drug/metabolite transporter (DMT)-like permease